MAPLASMEVYVESITREAEGIISLDLRAPDGAVLPPFTAGAHIDLNLPNGLVRSYSLCNAETERHRYVIAVNRDPASRGGSVAIHDTIKVGDKIKITAPRNNFPLAETAPHSIFIAGGIGVTPIYAMIQRLEAIGGSWELHYSTRLRAMCAFKDQFDALELAKPGRVHLNFDHEPDAKMTDLNAVIRSGRRDAHFYCCGPNGMLTAFENAVKEATIPPNQVHVEYFSAKLEPAKEGEFIVELAKSKKSFVIPQGKTILEVLLENDISGVEYSCMTGTCGTCETTVLEGTPDHRDVIYSEAEHAENKTMMICCSGSKTAKLVLDL